MSICVTYVFLDTYCLTHRQYLVSCIAPPFHFFGVRPQHTARPHHQLEAKQTQVLARVQSLRLRPFGFLPLCSSSSSSAAAAAAAPPAGISASAATSHALRGNLVNLSRDRSRVEPDGSPRRYRGGALPTRYRRGRAPRWYPRFRAPCRYRGGALPLRYCRGWAPRRYPRFGAPRRYRVRVNPRTARGGAPLCIARTVKGGAPLCIARTVKVGAPLGIARTVKGGAPIGIAQAPHGRGQHGRRRRGGAQNSDHSRRLWLTTRCRRRGKMGRFKTCHGPGALGKPWGAQDSNHSRRLWPTARCRQAGSFNTCHGPRALAEPRGAQQSNQRRRLWRVTPRCRRRCHQGRGRGLRTSNPACCCSSCCCSC